MPTKYRSLTTFAKGATGSTAQTQSNRVEYYYYDADLDILYNVIEYDEVVTGFITY